MFFLFIRSHKMTILSFITVYIYLCFVTFISSRIQRSIIYFSLLMDGINSRLNNIFKKNLNFSKLFRFRKLPSVGYKKIKFHVGKTANFSGKNLVLLVKCIEKMKDKFENVSVLIDKIKDVFKCTICSNVKHEDFIVFYWTCEHIFCLDCIETEKPCVICGAEENGELTGKQIKLKENENILTIFRSVLNYPNSVLDIKKSDLNNICVYKVPKTKNSNKELKLDRKENGFVEEECESNKKNELQSEPLKKNKKTLNVTKRNHKGETPLHLACRKKDLSLMQELINAGANPNTQDNAGWTPLHDAIVFGQKQVIQFLLDNGARVNTPGHENMTPLHQSVIEGNKEVTQLLLKYGADKSARNIYGETPMDLIKKYKITHMEEILLNTPAKFRAQSKIIRDSVTQNEITDMVLYRLELNDHDTALFQTLINQFKLKTVVNILPHHPPSHFIVSENEQPKLNWNIIVGVLLACQVVSSKWMKDSIEKNSIQPVEKYQLRSNFYVGFLKSRQNKINQLPGLFSGCHFYFGGNFECYKTKNCSFLKMELKLLVEKNGGVILSRNPDPESLALEKTIPYHADVNSSLCKTSYFIIYSKNSWNPIPKYNMNHMKTLPVEWLLACIFKFKLIDPNVDQSFIDEI